MHYELPNGKTVEISVEQYFYMTDDDFLLLMCHNAGCEFNDPFAVSVLRYGPVKYIEDVYDEELIEHDENVSIENLSLNDLLADGDYLNTED